MDANLKEGVHYLTLTFIRKFIYLVWLSNVLTRIHEFFHAPKYLYVTESD